MRLEDQIKCAKRELAMRKVVYPGRVRMGKMKQEAADKEIDGMEAIIATLEKIQRDLEMRKDY